MKIRKNPPTKYLKITLGEKHLINTRAVKELRVQSALSLGRIGTPEAIACIKIAALDLDKTVKAVCRMVLESEKITDKKAG